MPVPGSAILLYVCWGPLLLFPAQQCTPVRVSNLTLSRYHRDHRLFRYHGENEKSFGTAGGGPCRIQSLSLANTFTIIRAEATVEHIFSELYKVPAAIRRGYIRVKVLELLLILTGLDPAEDPEKRAYFPAAQIETIKQLHAFLLERFPEHYTIDELSERFSISPTVMKKCFRGVYGASFMSARAMEMRWRSPPDR